MLHYNSLAPCPDLRHPLYWGHMTYKQKTTFRQSTQYKQSRHCLSDDCTDRQNKSHRYSLALIFRFHRLLCLVLQRSTETGDRDHNKLRWTVWTCQEICQMTCYMITAQRPNPPFQETALALVFKHTAGHIPGDLWGLIASKEGKVTYIHISRFQWIKECVQMYKIKQEMNSHAKRLCEAVIKTSAC